MHWLEHSKNYVEMAIDKFKLSEKSQVVEIASNDGYFFNILLKEGFQF